MTELLAFVGDVHGALQQVNDVLSAYGGQRILVFLGDYVNKGPDSKGVVQALIEADNRWPCQLVFLRGNHDQSLLDFLATGDVPLFAQMGGLATVASYTEENDIGIVESLRRVIPRSHVDFLNNLADFFEREDVFASHVGWNPDRPRSRTRADVALTSHPRLFATDPAELGKTVVCGHYVQRDRHPYVTPGLIAIDTGNGTMVDGPLTVLLWPERRLVTFGGV